MRHRLRRYRARRCRAASGSPAVAVALAALLSVGGCRAEPAQLQAHPNLLLIVVDTLRADRLGVYGYAAPTTPNIDAFAADAVVYTDAVSPAPFTMPAMAAMLTGHYPDRTGVVKHSRQFILDTPIATLAERLAGVGYRSAAVVANPWLAKPEMLFNRGIGRFVTRATLDLNRSHRLEAKTVTDQALLGLKGFESEPSFLWIHYMDAHMPYQPPLRLSRMFGNPAGTSTVIRLFERSRAVAQHVYFARDLDTGAVERTRDLYDASVRYVDEQIGRILEHLRTHGLLDRTIIAITADHGESLGDHRLYFAHDFTLYDELVRVPLIVRIPGVGAARIDTLVSPMDIVPSVCAWLHLGCQDSFDGRVLPLRRGDGTPSPTRILFGASAPLRKRYSNDPFVHMSGLDGRWTMARTAEQKLIKIPIDGAAGRIRAEWQAYDLSSDAGENRNLLARFQTSRPADWPDGLAKLRASLSAWEAEMDRTRHVPAAGQTRFKKGDRRRLEALGYLQ